MPFLYPDETHCSLELKTTKCGGHGIPFSLLPVIFVEGKMDMSGRFATSDVCAL